MVRESNDARMLSFAPQTSPVVGGHASPRHEWAWVSGCLGLSTACSSTCETEFVNTCMSNTVSITQFTICEARLHGGAGITGCTPGCSPTLAMLQMSEQPVVSLSEGKFGTATGLTVTTSATRPACLDSAGNTVDFGSISTLANPPSNCIPPASSLSAIDQTVFPDPALCNSGGGAGASAHLIRARHAARHTAPSHTPGSHATPLKHPWYAAQHAPTVHRGIAR